MASDDQQPKKVIERLPSLGGLKNLTLSDVGRNVSAGASGAKKRTFNPVLPSQSKVKVKSEFVSEFDPPPDIKQKPGFVRQHQKAGNAEAQRGRGRGRGRGGVPDNVDESQFIQMKSVFSEGPMQRQDAHSKAGFYSGRSYSMEPRSSDGGGGGGGGGGYGRSGKGNKEDAGVKEERMDYKEDVSAILDDLLRDDFTVDNMLSAEDENMAPVVLPLCGPKMPTKKCSDEGKDFQKKKQDKQVCMEAVDVRQSDHHLENAQQLSQLLCSGSDDGGNGELLLIQLPDILPGIPFEKARNSKEDLAESNEKFQLSDYEESKIGEMVVRRSGKTQLILNNIVFDVVRGTSAGFLQELVSIRSAEELSSDVGAMTVIGHVKHKLLCIPDLEQLLSFSTNTR